MACCGPHTHDYKPELFQLESKSLKRFDELALKFYASVCDSYRSTPSASVLVTLRYKTSRFKAEKQFSDIDMLAFAELMMKHPLEMGHIQSIDLSYSRVTFHGVVALSEVLKVNHNITSVLLLGLDIAEMGAEALSLALGKKNRSVLYVNLRSCNIGEEGGQHFAKHLLSNDQSKVVEMDLSVNNIGNNGLMELRAAVAKREAKREKNDKIVKTILDLEGNLVLEEVLNSVTHGVGIILSFVGCAFILGRASEYGVVEYVAASIFSCALLLLYTSSTLYHAFFCCKNTNRIFQVFDHSAIYLLIAGTYTPVLMLALKDNFWSTPILLFQWIMCILGVSMEFVEFTGKVQATLLMYILMGWSILICVDDLMEVVSEEGFFW
eukprot:CAMPEP_0167755182 /NCGR_PEP_ID=MMETSP0110_2-20121227/8679_1 /TAXON_ID=629695 /ORGANISM="Gymnochlora sp., Strain CCMP2014" /LENGTH=379 /DNA_ID=CAMNT_0007641135 /DNA_START=103 /DNA_END=1239 /DNA_ORIENTATION=+